MSASIFYSANFLTVCVCADTCTKHLIYYSLTVLYISSLYSPSYSLGAAIFRIKRRQRVTTSTNRYNIRNSRLCPGNTHSLNYSIVTQIYYWYDRLFTSNSRWWYYIVRIRGLFWATLECSLGDEGGGERWGVGLSSYTGVREERMPDG